MKRLMVRVSPHADNQIEDISIFIAQDSVERAIAWQRRIKVAIQSLQESYGFAVDEAASEESGAKVRRYVFEQTYIIHFVINETESRVEVINIRHGARLPRDGEP